MRRNKKILEARETDSDKQDSRYDHIPTNLLIIESFKRIMDDEVPLVHVSGNQWL